MRDHFVYQNTSIAKRFLSLSNTLFNPLSSVIYCISIGIKDLENRHTSYRGQGTNSPTMVPKTYWYWLASAPNWTTSKTVRSSIASPETLIVQSNLYITNSKLLNKAIVEF